MFYKNFVKSAKIHVPFFVTLAKSFAEIELILRLNALRADMLFPVSGPAAEKKSPMQM